MAKLETASDLAALLERAAKTALQSSTRIWVELDGICLETNGRNQSDEVGSYRRIVSWETIIAGQIDIIAEQIHLNVEMLRQKGFTF